LGSNIRPIQCIEKNAEEIAAAHNADIAALEAERDELRRRLDAVDAERENDWRRTL
jgi:molecular chaperone GrpE (heat shock protein)